MGLIKVYGKNINLNNLFLFVFMSIVLTGCGAKDSSSSLDEELMSVEQSVDEDYRDFKFDDTIVLDDVATQVFLSKGEIDKDLTPEQLKVVEEYYKIYLVKSKKTIERFMYRAIPYLEYTKKVFKDKGLPEELAYLAFIESGYNPWAISRSGAVGMWQFMPYTGRHYGLVQDWWVDERRDPYKSTITAANYLQKLYNDFDDWFLAIAAYNAGEGKIGRALKATGAKDFFELAVENHRLTGSLHVKNETIQYVPRYIAMTKIMRNFEKLGFKPEEHSFKQNKPIIPSPGVGILAKPGTDLLAVAKDLNLSWDVFTAYNPAFRRNITPPERNVNFYVPKKLEAIAIASSENHVNSGFNLYKVVKGDNLTKISRRTGVPVQALRQLNRRSEPLQIGATLRIPRSARLAGNIQLQAENDSKVNKSDYNYIVKKGDALSSVAIRHGLGVNELMEANPSIKNAKSIQVGQKIYIPGTSVAQTKQVASVEKKTSAPSKQVATIQKSKTIKNNTFEEKPIAKNLMTELTKDGKNKTHTVVKGDTIYSIARKYGLTQSQLFSANPELNSSNKIRIGQKINVLSLNVSSSDEKKSTKTYVVNKGDTYWNISQKFSMSIDELLALNNLSKSQALSIGKRLKVYVN